MEYLSPCSSGSVTSGGGGGAWFLAVAALWAAFAAAAFLSKTFRSLSIFGLIIWFVDNGDSASILVSKRPPNSSLEVGIELWQLNNYYWQVTTSFKESNGRNGHKDDRDKKLSKI